ncbi:MAG: MoaD/ThiS family protein [Bacteroidetes bacterium]|jgi:sulfur-carrier protein|nr:MoaD/ThiS family protein [Bacteroidota bacterium]MBT6685383.1 MoaD/ThiS family protein [Bacteroidota bacterium]MBT7145037.1 MoaD/ThiS family protein [Bacteroidota bacterium]MBT7492722.1 MoaD/ThiS family protein [Bacteroidota bacterium]
MEINILFFGILNDIVGTNQIKIPFVKNISELKDYLFRKYPDLENQKFIISVNEEIADNLTQLSPNDEIALLPPFAGG